jgi:hypothetical protein
VERGAPVILRSSTNVEDLDGFNGAGLYASLSCKRPARSRQARRHDRQVLRVAVDEAMRD